MGRNQNTMDDALREFMSLWQDDRDYVEVRTSGSTGVPKVIRLLKDDMRMSARATNLRFGITSVSTLMLPLPMDYIAGKMMAVRAAEAGCRLIVQKPSNELEISSHVDLLAIVPSQVDSLLAHSHWTGLIKNVIVGGAPLDNDRRRALVDTGYNAYATYGMTETCSHVALMSLADEGGIYRAMPGIAFDLDDRGCLVIDAPDYSFGRLHTNDIVSLLDHESFCWRGRYDNVINSGGIKIFPEELEKEISCLVDVPFYIVGIPDEKWGECVEMVIEADPSEIEKISEIMRTHVDHRRMPKKIVAVDVLPSTANGKLRREKF